ncbi:MAG: bifunctional riboflavin kinase/FAD synthetase [Jaaginema sp. PMC 1079.18]|nr:bifunctional riboflavin kinase/FAD synthetase [Jaaginema sp. PMC 1080.18]MEC4850669.1 bifunctional riboflavin kinase/FAD synthetase [Jaaginema sp. PMC 1079.18]MEC4866497.1 bifunctional riboflavin kinase/FAD synthetase [Jaaginema sp. PMC 1078.18]
MWVTSTPETALTPTAIALGNFDGVHRGHQQVFQPILNVPVRSSTNAVYPTVVSFSPHPREYFTGQPQALLTPLPEKVEQLQQQGLKQLIVLPFDRELAALSPQAFVEDILIERLHARIISVGADFCFGRDRTGTAKDLQRIATASGIEVAVSALQTNGGDRISSSAIRQALENCQIATANSLLGRPYSLTGTVKTGQKLGRTIGFPTANLELPERKFLPGNGVYIVWVSIEGETRSRHLGVMNLGRRPTVEDRDRPLPEIHLIDWRGDLYERTLTVHLEGFLRPEQKFDSLEALKAQISRDCQAAKGMLDFEM